ncbi:MAG: hypothetical protein QUS12_09445 [Methanosarcina sp.]|nr:hypothetical protein [Methanosarcina sp.]
MKSKKSTRSNNNQKQNNDLSAESQDPSTLNEQPVLDTAASIPLGLESLESQIRGEALQEATVEKNPPKMASFLVGFIGTLLIGIALIKRRR